MVPIDVVVLVVVTAVWASAGSAVERIAAATEARIIRDVDFFMVVLVF
jgi:hypothetical protein